LQRKRLNEQQSEVTVHLKLKIYIYLIHDTIIIIKSDLFIYVVKYVLGVGVGGLFWTSVVSIEG
jgi:hypothetical protein